jgi:hypothetical protein
MTEANRRWFIEKLGLNYDRFRKGNLTEEEMKTLEAAMEKYGVDTSKTEGEKTAGEGGKCPICGAELDPNSPTPKCPIHGTAPFEGGDQVA